jgi:hypothetical protein
MQELIMGKGRQIPSNESSWATSFTKSGDYHSHEPVTGLSKGESQCPFQLDSATTTTTSTENPSERTKDLKASIMSYDFMDGL